MKTILYKAGSRGHANHGWLNTNHTFSFASYHNPERMSFGALRVLNDDKIDGGTGFPKHPHENMEIISIPLSGDLAHEDNIGNGTVIKENDVQVMSAGTGVVHSEFNHSRSKATEFLQIWVFPKSKNVTPRYGQHSFNPAERINKLQLIVSPHESDVPTWINQDAWFYLSTFESDFSATHKVNKNGNGIFIFLLEGQLKVGNEVLHKRDGIGIIDTSSITIEATENADFLLMEVPMDW